MVDEGSRVAGEAAKRGAETITSGAERLRSEAERLAADGDVADTARRTADEAVRGAEKAGKAIRKAAGDAGKKASKKAGEVFDDAKTYYDRASQFYDTSAKVTRASTAATAGVVKAREWIKENPGKAALVSFSLVMGVRLAWRTSSLAYSFCLADFWCAKTEREIRRLCAQAGRINRGRATGRGRTQARGVSTQHHEVCWRTATGSC